MLKGEPTERVLGWWNFEIVAVNDEASRNGTARYRSEHFKLNDCQMIWTIWLNFIMILRDI